MKYDFDIGRLCAAMQKARLVLRRPRQERFDAVREFVGRHWSDEGAPYDVPVNLLASYVQIVGRKLIANNPRVMLSTWKQAARPAVKAMEQWVNEELKRIKFSNTMKRVVEDALFSLGICKVALATPADAALGGWAPRAGEPMVGRIDLDDFVFDVHARDFSEVGYIGHRYRAPLRVIRESKIYSKDRLELVAQPDLIYNMEGDERIGMIGRTTLGGDQEEFEDFVDLWEVYLPRHRVVITLRDDQLSGASESNTSGKALRIQPWIGPSSGPYHILGFVTVPGNPMPKAPIQDLIDLHKSINQNIRKLIRQQNRQKTIGVVQGGQTEDGDRVVNANDGEMIRVDNPDKVKEFPFGGPNQQNYMLFEAQRTIFSALAGNLDTMGGLSPQANTAHQEQLLNTNSSATVSEMQDVVVTHVSDVIEALCWYWHHDPLKVQRTEYAVPGTRMTVPRHVFPNNPRVHGNVKGRMKRDHAFEDLGIKIDPYSMQHQTPQQRLQALNQVITQIYLPMAQQAQQQGIQLDLHAYFQKVAAYMDDPDLPEIITIGQPPEQEQPGRAQGPSSPKPQETTRNYVRRSQGQADNNMKTIMQQMRKPSPNGMAANGTAQ